MTKNTPNHQTEANCISPTDVIFVLFCFRGDKYEVSQDERHEQILRIAAEHDLVTLYVNNPIIRGRGPTHSIDSLTALGERCVDAYASRNWGGILHRLKDKDKEPTLEEMIAAVTEEPS